VQVDLTALRRRLAEHLGRTPDDVASLSLPTLRDLVTSANLQHEIDVFVRGGTCASGTVGAARWPARGRGQRLPRAAPRGSHESCYRRRSGTCSPDSRHRASAGAPAPAPVERPRSGPDAPTAQRAPIGPDAPAQITQKQWLALQVNVMKHARTRVDARASRAPV
jgi:hypothetical protein